MKELLKETHMLDFNDSRIQSLIENRGWKNLEQFECIKAIYLYVRDHQEMSIVKAFAYRHFGRHLMNKNVKRIRDAKV